MKAAFTYIFLFFILWAGVLFPIICTATLWIKEHRFIIFVADPKTERATSLENTLWTYCKKFARVGILSCLGLVLLRISK